MLKVALSRMARTLILFERFEKVIGAGSTVLTTHRDHLLRVAKTANEPQVFRIVFFSLHTINDIYLWSIKSNNQESIMAKKSGTKISDVSEQLLGRVAAIAKSPSIDGSILRIEIADLAKAIGEIAEQCKELKRAFASLEGGS
jgi:hypothetical protein